MITRADNGPDPVFDPQHARYAIGVLSLLIDVVGAQSAVGRRLILSRKEIVGLLDEHERSAA